MTRALDTHWKLHWVWLSRQGLGIWMSFMAWIKLTVHWVVSDCNLGEVSVYTLSKGCVGLHGLHTGVRGHVESKCPRS